jgi:hypothetical protein
MTIDIDTIKQKSWRSLTNISKKISEVVPAFANFYTNSTIPFVTAIVRIIATSAHIFPNAIERMFFSIMSSVAVRKPFVAFFTSTGNGVPSSKLSSWGDNQLAAIAFALPAHFAIGSNAYWPDRYQSSKTLACDINVFGHRTAPTVRVSSGGVDVSASTSLRTIAGS